MTKGEEALVKAYDYKGQSYDQIDCSHLVHQAFKDAGYNYTYCTTGALPESSAFTKVSLDSAQQGDIILFEGHMGFIEDCTNEDGEFYGSFFGSQSSTGPASASFNSKKGPYWGKTKKILGVYRKK